MTWQENLKKRLSEVDGPDEKALACFKFAQEVSAKIEETFEVVDYGLAIEHISIKARAKLIAHKATLFNRSGAVSKGLDLCNDFLKEYPQIIQEPKEYVHIEQLRILFLTQLARSKEAVVLGEKMFAFAESFNDTKLLGECCDLWRLTGAIAASMGDIEKGISYLERAKKINVAYTTTDAELPIIYGSLGDIYYENKDYKNARLNFERGADICRKLNNYYLLPIFLRVIGKIDMVESDFTAAKKLIKESIDLSKKNGDGQTYAKALRNYAQLCIKTNELHLFPDIEREIKQGDYYKQNRVFQGEFAGLIAEIKIEEEDFNEALKQAKIYEEITLELNEILRYSSVYELMIRIYQRLKDFKNVVEYYDKLLEVSSQVINESNRKLLEGYEAKFQSEKKEKEIQTLKLETVSFQLQSLRAQMNPHFVFNTIGSISQDLDKSNIKQSKDLLRSFGRLMRSNLEFADKSTIDLKDEIAFLNDYLALEQNRLGDKLQFEIECSEAAKDWKIPSMVVQPYIENAIKHGIASLESKGKILVHFYIEEDTLICEISDNGVGRKQAELNKTNVEQHIGKSTSINEKRLSLFGQNEPDKLQVNYTDLIDNKGNPKGTKVLLRIKS